jgi:hypothetical protein
MKSLEEGCMSKGICQYYLNCEFFKRYDSELNRKEKITIFHQYIGIYCFGTLRCNCYRYIQREETGSPPADDITPTGVKYLSGA